MTKLLALKKIIPPFHKKRARVLSHLAHAAGDFVSYFTQALLAYDYAIFLDPNDPFLYKEKGDVLSRLKKFKEALAAYEDAIRLKPDFSRAYGDKGKALEQMANDLKQQAQRAYEKASELDAQSSKTQKLSMSSGLE